MKEFWPGRDDQGPWLFDFAGATSGNDTCEDAEDFLAPGVTITDYSLSASTTEAEIVAHSLVNSNTAVKVYMAFPDLDAEIVLTGEFTTSELITDASPARYVKVSRSMLFHVRRL